MIVAPAGNLYIGTSGYSYSDWVGPFYPTSTSRADMLDYYARFFPIVELNFSYYRLPDAAMMRRLLQKAGDSVRFSVKGHQSFSHQRKYRREDMRAFVQALDPLADAGRLLGILWQFPFSFKYSRENAEYLVELCRGSRPHVPFVEFRHTSWFYHAVTGMLADGGACICSSDYPPLRGLPKPFANISGDYAYVRFHGRNSAKWYQHQHAYERYDYLYSSGELAGWQDKLKRLANLSKECYVFFNNHFQGQAVKNARMLRDMLKKR